MLKTTDLKNGIAFLHYGKPYQVTKYALIKMGRGGAVVKLSVRNLESGSNEELSFSSNNTVEEANTHKKTLQYLYKQSLAGEAGKDAGYATFMDPQSFDQIDIPLSVLGEAIAFVKEGENSTVLFWGDRALSIDLPPKITLTVADTDPGVKGNSVSNLYKPATLENGLKTKVPLFINKGEKIRIDTRTGAYIERAKNE